MKNITARCKCGCDDGFKVDFFVEADDPFVVVSTVTSGYHAKSRGLIRVIAERIKAAWFMLRGKEYCLHELILEPKQWKEFVEDINNVNKEMFDNED